MWIVYAIGSSFFAGITAILAKCGIRKTDSDVATVKALQSAGFDTIAAGDSFNDLGMIKASRAGFLFRTTDQIKKDYPELKAFETYDEFLAAIKEVLE